MPLRIVQDKKHGARWVFGGLVLLGGLLAAGMLSRFGMTPEQRLGHELRALAADRMIVLADGALVDCPVAVYGRVRAAVGNVRSEGPFGAILLHGMCAEGEARLAAAAAGARPERLPALPLFDRYDARSSSLHIVSRPPGAPVELDYRGIGITPLALDGIEPGAHHLRIRDRRFLPIEERLTLAPGQAVERIFELKAGEGRLAIASDPSGADIYLDGERQAARTPAVLGPLPAGVHHLELRHASQVIGKIDMPVPTGDTEYISLGADRGLRRPANLLDATTGVEFVWVPAGCFRMGCGAWTDSCDLDERPVHDVCVDGFWLGRYELTQAQWQRIMGANPASHHRSPDRPVNQVSWEDVQAYLRRLNARAEGRTAKYRLPSEAEWEYACRSGGNAEKFAGASELEERIEGQSFIDRIGWVGQRFDDGPFPPGGKRCNGLGLCDMSGNVWEWTQDTFNSHAYQMLDAKNPVLAEATPLRVVRGGSWFNFTRFARCSQRYRFESSHQSFDLGYRLVKVP